MFNENEVIHCVKVPRVLDWINTSTVIKIKEKINLNDIQVHDYICCNFSVPCGELNPTTLWTTYGIGQIGGTICINYHNGYGNKLTIFVNGEKKVDISEGSSFSGTFESLHSIKVQCIGKNGNIDSCYGEFKIMFHFYPNDRSDFNASQDIQKAYCFLSDRHGTPLDSAGEGLVTYKELTSSNKRSNVYLQNEQGETMTLQSIDYLLQGFVCVQFLTEDDDICCQYVFPFAEVETAFLCAPPGTKINCQTIDINCRAHIIPSYSSQTNCIEVVIIISICQSIKSVDDVIIELKGSFSHPRKDLQFSACNKKPPTI